MKALIVKAVGLASSLALFAVNVQLMILKAILTPLFERLQKTSFYPKLLDLLTEHRGIVILFFCLPISFIYDQCMTVRNWYFRNFLSAPELHNERVRGVQAQVRKWAESSEPRKKMCTARPEFLTMSVRTASYKKDCNRIDMNNMRDILEINTEKMTMRAEPLVDMGQVTRALLPLGFAMACQVEMEDLSIGGLCMGLGMEVNSHLIGLIQETVISFEMLLSSGEVVTVTRDNQYADLFHALPWSHGTLGFLMSVEVQIIKIKPYMHMRYIPCHSQKEYCQRMEHLSQAEDAPTMLEATIYTKETAVIMCGEFADVTTPEQKAKVNPIGYWWKPWFYKHVEQALTKGEFDEYIPLRHYYHRHTRSIFWELEDMIPFGNHPVYRYLFGWLGAPKIAFLKLSMTPAIRQSTIEKHVVQDIIIPITEMKRSVDMFHEWFDMYPLLVYPIRICDNGKYQGFLRKPENKRPGTNYEMFFDLGVYGVPRPVKEKKPWDFRKNLRAMEKYTRDVKGYQCPYADMLLTRSEFEEMFDHTLYRQMRKKYQAEGAFPEVYDKVRGQDIRVPMLMAEVDKEERKSGN